MKRCIFIANGYYEWKRVNNKKIPYYHYCESELLYFAGIYSLEGACIVTIASKGKPSEIHNRQPLILNEHELRIWTQEKDGYKFDNDQHIIVYQVSHNVNNPANRESKNIAPI